MSEVLIWMSLCLEATLDSSGNASMLPVIACYNEASSESRVLRLHQRMDILLQRTQELREVLDKRFIGKCLSSPTVAAHPSCQHDVTSAQQVGAARTLTVHPVYKCVGHEGSVFGVSWDEKHGCLVSSSDDRSARVWEPPLLLSKRYINASAYRQSFKLS
jgi:WD40 repeat protein